jgi:hypothetical protein
VPNNILSLDFLYMPSSDAAVDAEHFTRSLPARLVFAIEGMGTRVAMVESPDPPQIPFAEHLSGERPVLVFRVASLDRAIDDLESGGWHKERTLEIPQGPCASFVSPEGHRVAVYELVRPGVIEHFEGRRDF